MIVHYLQPVLGAATEPHTHRGRLNAGQVGVWHYVYNSAPTRVVPFRLEFRGNCHISVICMVPCGVAEKLVYYVCQDFLLGTCWWAIAYTVCIVFFAAHGDAEYTRCTDLCIVRNIDIHL